MTTPELDDELVGQLRAMAKDGVPASRLVLHLCEKQQLKPADAKLLAVAYFRKAFGLRLGEALAIAAWDFFPAATWTQQELDDHFKPILEKKGDRLD